MGGMKWNAGRDSLVSHSQPGGPDTATYLQLLKPEFSGKEE